LTGRAQEKNIAEKMHGDVLGYVNKRKKFNKKKMKETGLYHNITQNRTRLSKSHIFCRFLIHFQKAS